MFYTWKISFIKIMLHRLDILCTSKILRFILNKIITWIPGNQVNVASFICKNKYWPILHFLFLAQLLSRHSYRKLFSFTKFLSTAYHIECLLFNTRLKFVERITLFKEIRAKMFLKYLQNISLTHNTSCLNNTTCDSL